MDIFDPKILGDPNELLKFAAKIRQYADALEKAANILLGQNGVQDVRANTLIESYLKEHGPCTEDQLVEALKDKLLGRRNPSAEIKKSVRTGVRLKQLTEKGGKIHLP